MRRVVHAAAATIAALVISAFLIVIPLPRPAAAAPGTIHIEGGGWGHGVGMSQYGARGMATGGTNYRDILTHYYRGTAITSMAQPGPRVWLAEDASANRGATLTAAGNVTMQAGGQTVATAKSGDTIRINATGSAFDILVNNAKVAGPVSGNLYVYTHGAPTRLDKTGNRYSHGTFEFNNNGSRIRIVLGDVSMEEYLLGLGEMPSLWPADALKAQAVAGRTYAKEKIDRLGNQRPECGCGVWGTVSDQNYVGYEKEVGSGATNWISAVNSTAGQTVTYNGAAIQAFYASSSGGHTENSENVFVQNLPYLRGVPDPGDSYDNPLHTWARDYDRAAVEGWLNRFADTTVGTLDRVEFVPPFGVSGRVLRVADASRGGVRLVGSAGTKRVSGERFNAVVNSGIAAGGGGLSTQLLSTMMRLGGFAAYDAGFTGGVFVGAGPLDGSGSDLVVTGADAGGGPHVRVFTADGTSKFGFFPYTSGFRGGVRVAVCNIDGSAPYEIVTAPGGGGGPHVRVFDNSGTPRGGGFMAYDPRFTAGVYVACGDVNGDGRDEIITGAGRGGGPHVRVFNENGGEVLGFMAYDPRFTGGVRVASADMAGNNHKSIITGVGPGGGPHIRVFNEGGFVMGEFMAYDIRFTGGVYLGGGNIVGDGKGEMIVGAGEAGSAHVRVLNLSGVDVATGFMAFQTGNDHGVRVAAGHFPGGGVAAAAGTGSPPAVRVVVL